MNKIFSKILSIITAGAVTIFVSSGSLQTVVTEIRANAAENEVIYGDVNNDRKVDPFDLILIRREIANSGKASINTIAADVNIDGIVDAKDVIEVQDYLLGRTKGFTGDIKKDISEIDRSVIKKSISSKDMPEYCDVQINSDIAELTEILKTPESIFKYIANNVNTEFYNGLRKGAIGTFEQNGGNDYDQASLLLAMLTYMDFDASYAAVNANVTADDLIAITYAENIDAAVNIYTAQGRALTKQSDNTFNIERVGVYFDYNNETYFLDPAFKKYEKNPDAVSLNSISNEIEDNYFNDNQINEYAAIMDVESAYGSQSITDAFPQYKIIPQDFGTPSYKIVSDCKTALSVMDNVELYIGEKKAFSYPYAYLYNHNLTIEYEFVKYSEEEVQEAYKMFLDSLGLNSVDDLTKNLGTYEKQVLIYAVVKLDGRRIAVGAPGNLGDKEQLQIKFSSNNKNIVVEKELTYGALYSVIFDSQIISPYEIADLYSKLPQTVEEQNKLNSGNIYGSTAMMNTLSLIGKTYFSQVDTNNAMLANMSNSYYSRELSVTVVDYTPEIRNDIYVRLTGKGKIGIDVLGNWTIFNCRNNNKGVESELRHSAGYLSSYLESNVLEAMTGIRSVSTAEVFSQAVEQNIDIIHISKANLKELDNCNMSEKNKADITNYANQGMIITVPKDELTIYTWSETGVKSGSWTGTGYIVYEPQTDRTLYIINDNLKGGDFCSWVTLSYVCDLAIFFVECTWAFEIIMLSISLFCMLPFLMGGAALLVGLLGIATMVMGAKLTLHVGTELRDDTLLYMRYLDGDTEAGEQLKYSALDNAISAGVTLGMAKVIGVTFSKTRLCNSIGSSLSESFAKTPGGFEGALRIINRVSPSSGKAIAGFIGKFGNGVAKSIGNAYYSGGIEGVDSLLKIMEKYGETASSDFLTVTTKGADFSQAIDTYKALDDIAVKYSEDTMHYNFADGKYKSKYNLSADLVKLDKEAEEIMYPEIRALTDDVTTIAENTGWSVEDITAIKNHLFNDIVLKNGGYGLLDPDYEIAVAWKRLIEGDFYDCDILLLEHELFETTYYNSFHDVNSCTISEAHNFAEKYYNWRAIIDELMGF